MTLLSKDKVHYVQLNYLLMPRASTVLRKMFRTKYRDAFDTPWLDTEHQGRTFIGNVGKRIYTTASRRQKQLLRSGRVDTWDLQLLCNILLKLKFGREVDANLVEKLAKIHARVRRSDNHSVSREEFEPTWESVKDILIRLGDPISELESLETTANVKDIRQEYTAPPIDDETDEKADHLHRSANAHHKMGNLNDAISCYNECINLLASNRKLAAVYSHRSAAFLALNDEIAILSDNTNVKLARDDAKNAIELWPTWYEPHYRLGRAYERMYDDYKASKHYEIAFVLNPSKTKVYHRLDALKMGAEKEAFAIDSSAEFLESIKSDLEGLGGAYWTVWRGLCHLGGHTVEKDEKKAAILISQAAECGNTYAMLILANMFARGDGVEKDEDKYVELLNEVVRQPFCVKGTLNSDVATAEHNLGVACSKGIGVRRDLERAIEWYKMAVEHGYAVAAHNLGCHYMAGSGVEKDEGKAVELWKIAASGKLVHAMRRLCDYFYYTDLDPDRALEWHKMALCYDKEAIHLHLEDNLMILKELCQVSRIVEWEKRIGLSIDGYSIRERKYRYIRDKIPNFDFYEKEESLTEVDLPEAARKVFSTYGYAFTCVFNTANERLQQAVVRFGRAIWWLKEINKAGMKFKFVYELARCLETEQIVAHWDPPDRQMAERIIDDLWNDVLTYPWVDLFDKDARICYAYFHRQDEEFHRDCVEKYPEVAYFWRMLVGAIADHEVGLREAERALGVFENDWDLMFGKARHLASLGISPIRIVEALEEFVANAPPDHWLVPGAYYVMALMYVRLKPQLHSETEHAARQRVMDYFCLGMSAESNQLPCLAEQQNSRIEKLFELTLEMKLGRRKTVSNKNKLVEPSRVELIKLHRKRMRECGADEYNCTEKCVRFEKEKDVFVLLTLKFIDLNEIDTIRDNVYRGKAICVRIIEDFFVSDGINLLVEDRNGDVRSVRIVDAAEQGGKRFAYGARIIVRDPDVRMGMDARQVIRVGDERSVIFVSGGDLKVCRFCRKKIDKGMCANCKKAHYCSKQCQINDWKVLKHKLICF